MRDRIALLYLTHHWDRVHARRFERLRRETRGLGDSFVLLQSAPEGQDIAGQQSLPDIVDCLHVFDPATLPARLGYPYLTGKGVVPGCVHFPLQDFARQHAYDHYWLVENDVEFSGDWGKLIGACTQSRADLIAAHVTWHAADPVWIWWRYLTPPLHRPLNPAKLLRAFFPVYRISRAGLLHVDQMQRAGWRGHYEALIPTLLNAAGMEIADFRAIGQFYLGTRQDPPHALEHLDQLSTLRWRPQVTHEEFLRRFRDNVIFHPVKQAWTFDGQQVDHVDGSSSNEALR